MPSARFVTSSASANCGSSFGGTNEHTSMSRTPAATSALIQASFRSVGTTVLMFWMPSRRPTSRTSMNSAMAFSSGSFAVCLGQAQTLTNVARSVKECQP